MGALLVFGLLFLLWSFFFSHQGGTQTQFGSFGSAGTTTNTSLGGGVGGNGQVPLGGNAANGTLPVGTGVPVSSASSGGVNSTSDNGSSVSSGAGSGAVSGVSNVPGVTWLGGNFTGAPANSLINGLNGFTPVITTTVGPNGSGLSLAEILAGTAIAGSLSCALQAGLIAISTGSLGGSLPIGAGGSLALSVTGVPVSDFGAHTALTSIYTLQAGSAARNAGKDNITFMGCIVNTIAKAALAQITASTVNWINSGFNGQPSFVNNFQNFFGNVADLAAGQFIQGSGLAFLCSPFQLQIKIAIAQAYANRSAQSCTLTKVVGNVNNFMNGNFSAGGWGGLLSFTTVPTNNPYGAFAYAQVGLVTAQNQALQNAKNNITPNGFLALQQVNCNGNTSFKSAAGNGPVSNPQAAAAGGAQTSGGCTTSITTPGHVIEDSLSGVLKSPLDQLGLANDLDQIISALTTQLMTRVLQNGLTSVSQTSTQTPADIAAQSQATSLLNDMQSKTAAEQQLGQIYQGSISDIQAQEQNVSTLLNCWLTAASSTQASASQQSQAQSAASLASSTLAALEAQVSGFNDQITQVNSQIAALNQFQLDLSTVSTAAGETSVASSYSAAVSGGQFASAADVTTAQQNRATLQTQISTLNTQTQSQLTQCQAITGS
jgi:hypothetical protein